MNKFSLLPAPSAIALGVGCLVALLAQAPAALAQTAGAAASTASGDASATLPTVVVTGNPLGDSDTVAPATVLTGEALRLRQSATLGDTLDGLPGVASSYFGPNAGRPAIRGQDGDRIRILQNGGASIDASSLSYDHNAPIDPLTVERVEVLRGPAALLYGGSALGGVVNVIDNRIPEAPVAGPEGGVNGRASVGYASGNREKSGAAMVEAGNDRYALHVDAFSRNAGDTRAPEDLACERPGSPEMARRICNSANRANGGAVGGTVFFNRGYLGASASSYSSSYGTVAEDDVHIGMKASRFALKGQYQPASGPVDQLDVQWSRGNYHHTEFEGEETGTTFRNHGNDLRLQARHRAWGALRGVWGLQWEDAAFSATGEEAFMPPSRTRSLALFAHEELATGWGKLTFGARAEDVRVRSSGDVDGDEDEARFAAGQRRFHPVSAAFGALVNVAPRWQLTGNLAYTQRAPRDYELYANGPHVATAAWETGNPGLGLEKATSLDVGARWQDGPQRFAVTAFASHFANYIGLMSTGREMAGEDEPLPEFAYTGVRARFVGLEASGTVRLLGEQGVAGASGNSVLDLDLRADLVRAQNLSADQPLPRIAPARLGATLRWANGPWGAQLGFDHMAAQHRVPEGDRATGAYTLWNAAFTYRQKLGRAQLNWFARIDNLTNQLAYSATSVLTTTAFPKAPLPGRSLRVGVQATF